MLCAFFLCAVLASPLQAAAAISLTAFFIVAVSVVVGAALPLCFMRLGIDAAHAGPAIQVQTGGVNILLMLATATT